MSIGARLRDVYRNHFIGGLFSRNLFDQQADASPRTTHFAAAFLGLLALFMIVAGVWVLRIDQFYKALARDGVQTTTAIDEVTSKSFVPRRSHTIKHRVSVAYHFHANGERHEGKATFEDYARSHWVKGAPLVVVYDARDPSRNSARSTLVQRTADPMAYVAGAVPAVAMLLFWLSRYGRWLRARRLPSARRSGPALSY